LAEWMIEKGADPSYCFSKNHSHRV